MLSARGKIIVLHVYWEARWDSVGIWLVENSDVERPYIPESILSVRRHDYKVPKGQQHIVVSALWFYF